MHEIWTYAVLYDQKSLLFSHEIFQEILLARMAAVQRLIRLQVQVSRKNDNCQ